jgi:hypothetical protein
MTSGAFTECQGWSGKLRYCGIIIDQREPPGAPVPDPGSHNGLDSRTNDAQLPGFPDAPRCDRRTSKARFIAKEPLL